MKTEKPLYYSDYLELDKILSAQHPKSASQLTISSHDETLFIIVHQTFELWFLQMRHELKSVIEFFSQEKIDDNSEEMARIVQRLDRIIRIIKLITDHFEILETMQPLDFLEFRGLLSPASGFQSKQFRIIESMLGLQMTSRHMPEYYKHTNRGGFSPNDYEEIEEAENQLTLLQGLKNWLGRMPYFNKNLWSDYELMYPFNQVSDNKFTSDYFNIYDQLLKSTRDEILADEEADKEKKEKAQTDYMKSIQTYKTLFLEKGTNIFSPPELVSAMFIMLYRQTPVLRLPFEVIDKLIDIDELLSIWRYKHYLVVKKMIGSKPGTGGSAGAEYLLGALQKNIVFNDLTILATYFVERDKLPILPNDLIRNLNFKD